MEAIKKLMRVGYTRQQIADGLPGKTGLPLLRLYERGARFPGKAAFRCLVEMAEAKGLTLLARDFITGDAPCEPAE